MRRRPRHRRADRPVGAGPAGGDPGGPRRDPGARDRDRRDGGPGAAVRLRPVHRAAPRCGGDALGAVGQLLGNDRHDALPRGAPRRRAAMPTTRAGALTPVTANARRISARITVNSRTWPRSGRPTSRRRCGKNVSMALSDGVRRPGHQRRRSEPERQRAHQPTDQPGRPHERHRLRCVRGRVRRPDRRAVGVPDTGGLDRRQRRRLQAGRQEVPRQTIDTGNRGGVSLGDTSFADYAQEKTGGFWTNKRMPATAPNIARHRLPHRPDGAADRVSPDLGHRLDRRHLLQRG